MKVCFCPRRFVGLTKDTQELDISELRRLVTPRTKLISLVHVSNALGAVLPGTFSNFEEEKQKFVLTI